VGTAIAGMLYDVSDGTVTTLHETFVA